MVRSLRDGAIGIGESSQFTPSVVSTRSGVGTSGDGKSLGRFAPDRVIAKRAAFAMAESRFSLIES